MQNFIYFYNGGPFSNGAIEVLPDHDKIWEQMGINSTIFNYEMLTECFSKVFNHSIQISSYRILGIPIPQYSSKIFIVIEFSMDSEVFRRIGSLEIEEKLNAVLNRFTKINKYYYYVSLVFLNDELIYFIEQEIRNRLEKKILSIGPKFRMEGKGFSLEINSYIHKNYRKIFEKLITSFFNREFPGFIKNRPISLMQHNYHLLIEGYLDKTVLKSFLDHIFMRIETYHSIISSSLSAFNSRLIEKKDIIRSYPFHTLRNLERYFDDLNRRLNSPYWLFPNPEYGRVLFKLEPNQNDPNFELNKLFDQSLSKFALLNNESFQPFKNSLKETLVFFIQLINNSMIQKQGGIKTFKENELSERLNSIENEAIFRKEILIPILRDLGYENVQEIHGQHEYGVDILFSNINKFKIMEWNGIVVKTGDINLDEGTEISRKIKTISKQVYQAKKMDHMEKNYHNVKITRVFIATNGKINYHGKQALFKEDPMIAGNLFFLDYDAFMNLF